MSVLSNWPSLGRRLRWIIPGHPPARVLGNLPGIAQEAGKVVEGVDLHEITGVDETHEEVAHRRASLAAIKERVLSVPYRHLESSFAQIMPTAGLCRVRRSGVHTLRFGAVADAA